MANFYVYGIPPVFTLGRWLYEVILYESKLVCLQCFSFAICPQETRIVVLEKSRFKSEKLIGRYKSMKEKDVEIVGLESEMEDGYSDDSLFNISSWGADLSFRELISMYEDNELVKPELQRKYVWDREEASRFIESILLGLPVPSIFLAQSGSEKLIVDGYQRIMTVYDYVRGIFSTDGKIFRLSNSEKINQRWRNKAFVELSTDDQRKIRSTTIHAIIFEQKKPANDDTSLYQIFERINTSGRTLTAQEIRNCVYQGSFNSLLFELNDYPKWRELFGSPSPDSRMRDLEYILRFYLMKSDMIWHSASAQIPLKKSLNDFMHKHQHDNQQEIAKKRDEFISTIDSVYDSIGKRAFKNFSRNKFNNRFHPAIYDAIMVSAFFVIEKGRALPTVSEELHKSVLTNEDFSLAISKRTTDVVNIKKRVIIAGEELFRIEL